MLKPSPINTGAAALGQLRRALRSRRVPAYMGDLSLQVRSQPRSIRGGNWIVADTAAMAGR